MVQHGTAWYGTYVHLTSQIHPNHISVCPSVWQIRFPVLAAAAPGASSFAVVTTGGGAVASAMVSSNAAAAFVCASASAS